MNLLLSVPFRGHHSGWGPVRGHHTKVLLATPVLGRTDQSDGSGIDEVVSCDCTLFTIFRVVIRDHGVPNRGGTKQGNDS